MQTATFAEWHSDVPPSRRAQTAERASTDLGEVGARSATGRGSPAAREGFEISQISEVHEDA